VADQSFSLGTPVSFTNKTYRHDISEILLKVVLNTLTLTLTLLFKDSNQDSHNQQRLPMPEGEEPYFY
jgi:hypothetical protein